VILIMAVVIGGGIIASMYLGTTTTGTMTIDPSLAQQCNEQVWSASSRPNSTDVPVLLMQPLSTAYVCVTYQSGWQGNSNQYRTEYTTAWSEQFNFSIFQGQCTLTPVPSISCVSTPFAVGNPPSFQVSASTDYVTVVFTVSSLGNSTGFYYYQPSDSCDSMPMAVGHAASQVNGSDFDVLVQSQGCMPLAFAPWSVSVGGMSVTYVALQGAFGL
jgi:hypothetical protein